MRDFIEQVQPYIVSIVVAIIGVLTTMLLGFISNLKTRVNVWIDTKTSASQREILHKVASEAFSHAEAYFKAESSQAKMNQALDYASKKLANLGVKMTTDEIKAAIEKACLEYNANKVKVVKDGNAA